MTMPPPSTAAPDLQFSFAGHVTVWDPIYRHLEIGTRAFAVAPRVSVPRLAAGVQVTVTGYVERPAAEGTRWIVTQVTAT